MSTVHVPVFDGVAGGGMEDCHGRTLPDGISFSFVISPNHAFLADILYSSMSCFSNSESLCARASFDVALCMNARSLSDIGHFSIPRFGRVIADTRLFIFASAVALSVPDMLGVHPWNHVASLQSIEAMS